MIDLKAVLFFLEEVKRLIPIKCDVSVYLMEGTPKLPNLGIAVHAKKRGEPITLRWEFSNMAIRSCDDFTQNVKAVCEKFTQKYRDL